MNKSSLTPDDIDAFEAAASPEDMELGTLAPPYDPALESRTRGGRSGGARTNQRALKALENELWAIDRFRLKSFKSQIRWARKRAEKAGIDPQEVDLWLLSR